jgi:hypothetical protein
MTKAERKALKEILRAVRADTASPEVKEALQKTARLYVETWIIPGLEMLLAEPSDTRTRRLRDFAS